MNDSIIKQLFLFTQELLLFIPEELFRSLFYHSSWELQKSDLKLFCKFQKWIPANVALPFTHPCILSLMSQHTYRVVKKLYGFDHPVCMLNKKQCVKFLCTAQYMIECDALSILTPFSTRSCEKRNSNARKMIFQGGGQKFHILIKFDHLMDF